MATLIAIVLALVVLARSRAVARLERRLAQLELEVSQLRRRLEPPGAPPHAAADIEEPAPGALRAPPTQTAPGPAPLAPAPPAAVPPARVPPAQVPPAARAPLPRPAPGAAPAVPPSPARPSLEIDWERWIGVRGAAVLGGVVLALAGLFFFRYSIEHGLIPPWLRVVLGTLVGLGCILGAERWLRERYAATANALAGAGVVVLYSAAWAAGVLYHLVATPLAFVLMIAVTVAASVLSWRHASLVIALIGVAGGFATPFLLSSGTDHPIGLFAYLLLLDIGLLVLAERREWPLLALLSLVATALYETAWIIGRMGADRLPLGLLILGVFAVVFAAAGQRPRHPQPEWIISQAAAVLFPFAFALYFAAAARFGVHLYPLAFLLLPLSAAACWLGRVHATPALPLGSAAAVVAVVGVWLFSRSVDAALTWELAVLCVAFAGVFHAFVELDRERAGWEGPAPAAIVAAAGLLGVVVLAATVVPQARLWPLLAGWLGLGAWLVRHGAFVDRARLQIVPATAIALGLWLFQAHQWATPAFPAAPEYLATVIAVAWLFQALALARSSAARAAAGPQPQGAQLPTPEAVGWAERAAALFPLLVLPALSSYALSRSAAPSVLLLSEVLLGGLAALAAARLGSGRWLLAAVLTTALAHTLWSRWTLSAHRAPAGMAAALALQLLSAALFTAWPFLVFPRFRTDRWAWYAAALAPVAWFLVLLDTWKVAFGSDWIGLLPVLLGALALGAAAQARRAWPEAAAQRQRTLVWLLAVALGFGTAAIPLQLEKEWITIGWALEAAALVLLWQRFDHPGLKYLAAALAAGVTVRLAANPAVLGYYPRPAWRIVNWLMYTYLIPAAALLLIASILQRHETARLRAWERPLYAAGRPLAALGCALAGLLVVFLWINLAIADWFATGATLRVSFERLPARDLATSIAWAAYALLLLALGVQRRSRALRWVSLGLMMVTIGKVFLYDLGELRDLYRVASLLGLAVSLIVVSLAYQRFVLREAPAQEEL